MPPQPSPLGGQRYVPPEMCIRDRQYAAKVSEKGLSLQLQDTDAFAVFDFKWTAEALANIVDNAIKYTEHGTIRISAVSYEMFARIDISDTGSGISESEQAKIFARFYRSNSVRKQEGVGLSLIHIFFTS